jgi:hypothetical protein
MIETNREGVDYCRSYEGWAEVFSIFSKYYANAQVCCEHDQIWAGPESDQVSEDDLKRLGELGWWPSPEGGFTRYV